MREIPSSVRGNPAAKQKPWLRLQGGTPSSNRSGALTLHIAFLTFNLVLCMAGWASAQEALPLTQSSRQERTLSFKPASDAATTPLSHPSYLKIVYVDRGYGHLGVTYKTADGQWRQPDKATQAVLLDTGRPTASYQRCAEPLASPPEIKVRLEQSTMDTLTITQVLLQKDPFTDEHFRYLLDEAWRRPYAGPSVPVRGPATLRGKVMVGYQGWFRTPNDPYNTGWRHWGDIAHGTFSVDMWPDVSLYPSQALDKVNDVHTLSGKTASLFSSGWPEVVDKHFALMRLYDIDGAFVQRFVSHGSLHALGGDPEWVLGNARAAAHRQGRLWAVEYDVSGCPDTELLADIKKDWAWLVDQFGVSQDGNYAREGTRPVVFVWGMAVPDRRISPLTADAVVDFLKHDPTYGGNYVIEGLPAQWRTLDADWQRHFAQIDGALAWQSQNYADDVADFRKPGVDYYPHVWPGFSWANLKHLPTGSTVAFTPREGGGYYERLLSGAVDAGADRLFVGMFDEYDEGTAILPMSDDPPPTSTRPGLNLKFLPDGDGERPLNTHLHAVDLPLSDQPPLKGIPAVNYTMRFEGEIIPPTTGRYVFRVEGASGDQATLDLDQTQTRWSRFPDEADPAFGLLLKQGAAIPLQLEYQHHAALGRLRLTWETPGGECQTVPESAFVDAWGRFLTNEGQPADHWLNLTTKWRRTLTERLATPIKDRSTGSTQ